MVNKYEEFNELRNGTDLETLKNEQQAKENLKNTGILLDSIQKAGTLDISSQLNKLDSTERIALEKIIPKNINNQVLKAKKDSTKENSRWSFTSGSGEFDKMVEYQKNHPDVSMDNALDSLKIKKNLRTRFMYSRASVIQAFRENPKDGIKNMSNEVLSYASISIFIFLPIFTLFLRFLYIRRKYTYIEHLIFVFHTQTVFFLLLLIFFIIGKFVNNENIVWIFLVLFLGYLLIAMKRFYQQGYIKTFIKFVILNHVYTILGGIGLMIVSVIAFALY